MRAMFLAVLCLVVAGCQQAAATPGGYQSKIIHAAMLAPVDAVTPLTPVSGKCSNCRGTGKVGDGTIAITCPVCKGTGNVSSKPTLTSAVLRNPVCPLACDCEKCGCTDAANCNQATKPAERVTKMPAQTVSRGGCANGSCAVPAKKPAQGASAGSCASGSCGMSGGRVFPNRPRLFRRWR